jgi:hypothetical protein
MTTIKNPESRIQNAALRSRITDHGPWINNQEVPKILISDQWSLIIERQRRAAGTVTRNLFPVTSSRQRRARNPSPVTSPSRQRRYIME